MEDHLGEYDPNRAILESEREGVRPDFYENSVGDKSQKKLSKSAAGQRAKEDLGAAEKAAGDSDLSQAEDNLYGAKKAENKYGYYSGGKKNSEDGAGSYGGGKGSDGKGKGLKGKLKKRFALGAILAVLGISGTFLSFLSFQPFGLVEQFRDTFNSMETSADIRSNRFFKAQMSNGRTKNPIKGTIFNKHFKITKKQQEKLKMQGIEYDEKTFKDSKGKPIKVLKYDDGSGNVKVVTVDKKSAKKLNEVGVSKYNKNGVKFSEAISFKNLYAKDTNFFRAYNSGSMTWRGAIANWFGSNTSNFLKTNKLTRSMWKNWEDKKEEARGKKSGTKKAAQDIMRKNSDTIEDGGVRVGEDGGKDDDGNDTLKPSEDTGAESIDRASMDKDFINAKLDKISGNFSKAANIGCAIMGTLGAVNLLVQASEALQIMQLTTGYFEAVDKTKAGLGEEAPINELTSALNEKKENTHVVFEPTGVKKDADKDADKIGETVKTKKVTSYKSAMESEGVAALFKGTQASSADPSVASFNLMASSNQILGGLSLSTKSFEGCLLAKAAAAAVSAGVATAKLVSCVGGIIAGAGIGGIPGCASLAAEAIVGVVLSISLKVALDALIAVISPAVVNMLTRDLISELGGEDLGNAITSGANIYQGGTHRANGGSLANKKKYKDFAIAQQETIAKHAREDRAELSPFDTTSKNTFMGTLLTQLMSYVHADTLMSTVSASTSVVSSALTGVIEPSAMAYGIAESLPKKSEYEDTCPYLASIGAVGDAFCNPYIMSDLSSIEDDPADVINKVDSYDAFEDEADSEGNVVIKKDSDLAMYIRYCDNRGSAFGVPDQNIANEVGDFGQVDSDTGNAVIGATPVLGDALDIVSSIEQNGYIGYISGESCVAGNKDPSADSPNWAKGKYYQRFIEDQSLAESMGIIEKSAVTAYLEDYYKEHPLDNSYEGMLARYSGLTKDTVVAVLDIVQYYDFVANYDSGDRYAFGEPVKIDEGTKVEFDNENLLAGDVTLLNNIVYADVRNRVFVV